MFVFAGVLVVVVLAATAALLGRPNRKEQAGDVLGVTPTTAAPQGVPVGSGRAPDGASWTLVARRDSRGRICNELMLNAGPAPREECDTPPGVRPFGPVRTRASFRGGQVVAQTWGLVSQQTMRVRATTEDGTTTDAEVIGGDAGFGVKFFMSYVDRLGGVTFVALGANGEELGRVDPPPIPPPPGS